MTLRAMRPAAVGVFLAILTSAFAWLPLDPLVFHAVALAAIGTVYVGVGLMDGRLGAAAHEMLGATAFMVLAFVRLWDFVFAACFFAYAGLG